MAVFYTPQNYRQQKPKPNQQQNASKVAMIVELIVFSANRY